MTPSTTASITGLRPCLCGCGRETKSTWFPGDDARAKSLLREVARGERTVRDLPGDLPKLAVDLALRWKLAFQGTDDGLVWSAEAKAPPKAPKDEHAAARHLRRAIEALGNEEEEVRAALTAILAELPRKEA